MGGEPAGATVGPPDPTPASGLPTRHRTRNFVARGVVLAAAVALAWFVARLAQRPELFAVCAAGLGLVALVGVVRGLTRTVTGRWKKVLLLGGVVLLIGAACLGSSLFFSFGRENAAAPPPGSIVLPLAVSAEYAGDGKVNDDAVELDEELVVSNATMNRVRDDLLKRVLNARDPGELVAAVQWCLETDGSSGPAVVPATWTLPEGISLVDPSVDGVRELIAANWEGQCFRPERLDSSDWELSLRRDDAYVYRRERLVPFDVGWLYSTPMVDAPLRSLSVTFPANPLGFRFAAAPPAQPGEPGVTLDASFSRSSYFEGPYILEPAGDSSIRLTGAAQAIAGVDPASTVVSQPGVGDRVVVDVGEHTDAVNLVVLSSPFRNSPGRAIYQSLQWGPLQWVLGLVTLIVSGLASDLGLGLLKRILGRVRRPSPTLRAGPPSG